MLDKVAQIAALRADASNRPIPVALHAWVTASAPAWNTLIVQDDTGGVKIDNPSEYPPVGQSVEVDGFVSVGGSSPAISHPSVKALPGARHLPRLQAASSKPIDLGQQYRFCRLTGLVRSADLSNDGRLILSIVALGDEFEVRIANSSIADRFALVDSAVQIDGVFDLLYDLNGRRVQSVFWVNNASDLVVRAKSQPLESAPSLSVAEARRLSPEHLPAHRVRMQGQAIASPGASGWKLSDGAGSIPILARSPLYLPEGQIELAGYLLESDHQTVLVHPEVIRTGDCRHCAAWPRVLTQIQEIRNLSAAGAARAAPVSVTATITFADPVQGLIFVQNRDTGIYVEGHDVDFHDLKEGQRVRVTGVTGPGEFAPEIERPHFTHIGAAPLPAPALVSTEELFSGRFDSAWVRVEGSIEGISHAPGETFLQLRDGVHRFDAQIPDEHAIDDSLKFSRVSIEGVCGTNFNSRRQVLGISVYVPSAVQVHVLRRSPDLGTIRSIPIAGVLQFSPHTQPDHPVKVEGVVTYSSASGLTYIQDHSGALMFEDKHSSHLNPGSVVRAIGIAWAGESGPTLESAEVRRTGVQEALTPPEVSAEQVLGGGYESQLIRISGQLMGRLLSSTRQTLYVRSGRTVFHAQLQNPLALSRVENGCSIR